eukprot:1127961-Amphidinium_carterae.1
MNNDDYNHSEDNTHNNDDNDNEIACKQTDVRTDKYADNKKTTHRQQADNKNATHSGSLEDLHGLKDVTKKFKVQRHDKETRTCSKPRQLCECRKN